MGSTYVNNLRLEEMTTGEKSGTWGNITNVNLELVGQALGYGTRAIADASTDNITIADGASDADRSMYLKLTGGGQACTITLLPNTSSKMWVMENATSYTLTFSQGSGANVAIPAGQTKMIFADGLGGGAVVYEIGTIAVGGVQSNGTVTVGVDDTGHDVTFFGATAGKKLLWDESADALIVTGDGTFQGLDTSAISGIIEANANFIDMCLVGPSIDGQSWNGKFSNGAVWTSLMLATVETAGSDAQLNIWDLTAGTLASATPLATLTLSGATSKSIAASMGYVMVGTQDQGFHIVDPHTGAWAERVEGALKSLSHLTVPALADGHVNDVAIQMPDTGSPYDPNTGGLIPFIAWTYGGSADECGILNNGVVYNKNEESAADNVTAINSSGYVFTTNNSSDYGRKSNVPIYQIFADDWGTSIFFDGSGGAGPTFTGAPGDANSISLGPNGKVATATDAGLNYGYTHSSTPGSDLAGYVNRTFTTGYLGQGCVLAGLANSDTADRSGNSHNLTEEGTVAEVTIASGAELKGYQFATGNYLKTPLADAAFEMGTGSFTVSVWVYSESDPGNAGIVYYRKVADGATPQWGFFHNGSQQVFATVNDGTDSVTITSSESIIDSKPHLLSMVFNGTTKELSFFIDGALQGSDIDTDVGTVSGGSGYAVGIGNIPEGGAYAWDGTNSWMALIRILQGSVTGTETDFLQMYRDELPLYSANAKCLLQSGTTDVVLDAAVDPLTGKVIVTQTDSQEIFDGLVIETERTVATGGSTFEHGLLFGDAVAEINNANLFASTPATDQRQVNEMVRSLSADMPGGVDLSKAKAYYEDYGKTSASLVAGYNIESIARNGTGDWTITFAIPFKTDDYIAAGISNGDIAFAATTGKVPGSTDIRWYNTSGAAVDARGMVVFFGELENE